MTCPHDGLTAARLRALVALAGHLADAVQAFQATRMGSTWPEIGQLLLCLEGLGLTKHELRAVYGLAVALRNGASIGPGLVDDLRREIERLQTLPERGGHPGVPREVTTPLSPDGAA